MSNNDRISSISLQEIKDVVKYRRTSLGYEATYNEFHEDYILYLLSEVERLNNEMDSMEILLEDRNPSLLAMKEALKKAERFISTMMEFYGEGLTVYNWHQNGEGEPLDNFFDNNMEGDELEAIRAALSHLKG